MIKIQIKKDEKVALKITGYDSLGKHLKDISQPFVGTTKEQLAWDHVDEIGVEQFWSDCVEYLETIINMIERLTGLKNKDMQGWTGSEESFKKLDKIYITN